MPNAYGETPGEIEAAKAKEDARRLVKWERDYKRWAANGGEGTPPQKPRPIPRN